MTATAPTTWPITFDDVERARARVSPYITPTPLRSYPLLDAATGLSLFVKHENHQPTG
jgi:threonine dehydratase